MGGRSGIKSGMFGHFTGARKRVLRVCARARESRERPQLMEQLDYHLLYRQNKWAGNLDLKVLGVGSTLYIPVFNEGALFFTGDPHGVQGDGEVDGGALGTIILPLLVISKIKN